MILQADKGGKTVIIDRAAYKEKVAEHINSNVTLGNYMDCNISFDELCLSIEKKYSAIIAKINPFLLLDKSIKDPLRQESYLLPMFYGCPKIHKPTIPLRPIISSCNMIGDFLSTWLLEKLNIIALFLNKYNVTSAVSVMSELKSFKLEPDHVLCSFDYDSMFTNIDMDETIVVITNLYHLVAVTTSVPCPVFLRCLVFSQRYCILWCNGSYICSM